MGRTVRAVHLKTISTAVLAWMVIVQLRLPVNSAKKCAWMPKQTDEQSSRSEKWLKFSGNVEWICMTIGWECFRTTSFRSLHGDHGRAQSLETNSACTNSQESHSHRKRSIAWENWSYRASWRGGHVPKIAMRQQRKDLSPTYNEAQRELRCYFSGVSQRRIERKI